MEKVLENFGTILQLTFIATIALHAFITNKSISRLERMFDELKEVEIKPEEVKEKKNTRVYNKKNVIKT